MRAAIRAIALRPTLFGSLGLAVAAFALSPVPRNPFDRGLVAWCLFVAAYIASLLVMLSKSSPGDIRRKAQALDESSFVILAFSLLAAVASYVAVVKELAGLSDLVPLDRSGHLILTAATIVSSWFFVQAIFAVHYAHKYYGSDEGSGQRRGLDFGEDKDPDYLDFTYFAVTIGATSQTSDVAVRSGSMRRTVLAQSIFSFFFNATVLALAINIAAALVKG